MFPFVKTKRSPFDRKNPLGFTLTIALESFVIWLGFCLAASVATFAIGNYLYAIAFTKLIRSSLHEINRSAEKKNDRARAMKQLVEFIQFQSESKQLSKPIKAFDCFLLERLKITF